MVEGLSCLAGKLRADTACGRRNANGGGTGPGLGLSRGSAGGGFCPPSPLRRPGRDKPPNGYAKGREHSAAAAAAAAEEERQEKESEDPRHRMAAVFDSHGGGDTRGVASASGRRAFFSTRQETALQRGLAADGGFGSGAAALQVEGLGVIVGARSLPPSPITVAGSVDGKVSSPAPAPKSGGNIGGAARRGERGGGGVRAELFQGGGPAKRQPRQHQRSENHANSSSSSSSSSSSHSRSRSSSSTCQDERDAAVAVKSAPPVGRPVISRVGSDRVDTCAAAEGTHKGGRPPNGRVSADSGDVEDYGVLAMSDGAGLPAHKTEVPGSRGSMGSMGSMGKGGMGGMASSGSSGSKDVSMLDVARAAAGSTGRGAASSQDLMARMLLNAAGALAEAEERAGGPAEHEERQLLAKRMVSVGGSGGGGGGGGVGFSVSAKGKDSRAEIEAVRALGRRAGRPTASRASPSSSSSSLSSCSPPPASAAPSAPAGRSPAAAAAAADADAVAGNAGAVGGIRPAAAAAAASPANGPPDFAAGAAAEARAAASAALRSGIVHPQQRRSSLGPDRSMQLLVGGNSRSSLHSSASGKGRGPSPEEGAASPFVDAHGFFDLGAAAQVCGRRSLAGLEGLQVGDDAGYL